MTTCTHPGCHARVMREGPCSRHRPKPPRKPRTPEQRARESAQALARYHAKGKITRAAAGAMGNVSAHGVTDSFGVLLETNL